MKYVIACALLCLSSVAAACPPPSQHPDAVAERESARRQWILDTPYIVYGVVEREITSRQDSDGRLRVLHVYKGDLRVGQRLRMRYARLPGSCPVLHRDQVITQPRGSYGVALVRADPDGNLLFSGFQPPDGVESLIRDGYIRSARPDAAQAKARLERTTLTLLQEVVWRDIPAAA